jgi:membrane protein implicated in regulation of membrane protease activity
METFFLACFAFGLLFTVASLLLGSIGGHFGHVGHGAHVGHGGHGAHVGHDAHVANDLKGASLPLLNASSVIGALTWFGAAGYVVTRLGGWTLPFVLLVALIAAALGWYLVARFLGLVLKGEVEMDPADYRLEGTLGQLTVSIPAGGTGEIVFEKAGLRRSEAARALNGAPIARGSEVVITRYANGFATVQPWREFLAERDAIATSAKKKEG